MTAPVHLSTGGTATSPDRSAPVAESSAPHPALRACVSSYVQVALDLPAGESMRHPLCALTGLVVAVLWSGCVAIVFGVLVLCGANAMAEEPAPRVADVPPEVRAAFAQLSASEFHAHLAFLSDDLLEGRGTGTRGHEIAAKYMAAQFERMGLEPGGDHGTYFQRVPLRETTTAPESSALEIVRAGKSQALRFGSDFLAWARPDGKAIQAEAPVVFVNYGVSAPSRHYDDYAGVDVRGKIVAVLDGAPSTLPAEERGYFADYPQKRRAAEKHGAIGIISLDTPEDEATQPWELYAAGTATQPVLSLRETGDARQRIYANAALSPVASAGLFNGSGKIYAQVLADAGAGKRQSFALPIVMRLHVGAAHFRDLDSPNVIGILRGSDPKLRNEYVVYSAHLDHLGIGKPINGDSIYNGTIDNASGSSALLLLAHAFASMPRHPARSIIFLSTTAEEKGHWGSEYFSRTHATPNGPVVADLNMDGVPVTYRFKSVVAFGAEHSSIGEVMQRDFARFGLAAIFNPEPRIMRTDAYTFAQHGIPAAWIEENDEAMDPKFDARKFWKWWRTNRYHTPLDDMSQPMDLTATMEYLKPMVLVGWEIANSPQRPTWNAGDFFGRTFGGMLPLSPAGEKRGAH